MNAHDVRESIRAKEGLGRRIGEVRNALHQAPYRDCAVRARAGGWSRHKQILAGDSRRASIIARETGSIAQTRRERNHAHKISGLSLACPLSMSRSYNLNAKKTRRLQLLVP